MSKIPQGEWNTIAARHAQGETITRIAYDYGCTAPAIHYILKRQRERAQPVAAGTNMAAMPAAGTPAALPFPEMRPVAELRLAAEARPPLMQVRPVPADVPPRENPPTLPLAPPAGARRADDRPPERLGGSRLEPRAPATRGSALAADFDAALQSQIEAVIETFRTNLNAALADRSPTRREELRAAASDLMRMAARTMIVLDRLSAGHERIPARAQDYPRSAHAR